MKILTCEQRSPEWHQARHGRITMSHAGDLLTGGKGVTRASYLRSVAAEILSPEWERSEYQSEDMLRGCELESFALEAYQAVTGAQCTTVGFVIADDDRIGCSPDALPSDGGGVEIKCPTPANHLSYLDSAKMQKDHGAQVQGSMWVCNAVHWDLVSFCPWVTDHPMIIHRIHRDPDIIDRLSESAIRGADEVESMVAAIKTANRNQQTMQIAKLARAHWSEIKNEMNAEVQL